MSPVSKTVIVAESPTSVQSHGPWGVGFSNWMQSPVGEGTFTVESDKAKLGPSIRKLIEARKAKSDRDGDLGFYRFLCAISSKPAGRHGRRDEGAAPRRVARRSCDSLGRATTRRPPGCRRSASPSSRAAPTSSHSCSSAVPTSSAARTDLVPERDRAFAAGETDPHRRLLHDGSQRRRRASTCSSHTSANREGDHGGQARTPRRCSTPRSACRAPPDRAAARRRPNALASAAHFGLLPFEQVLQSGKPTSCVFVLDHYSEQLQGLPDGVNRVSRPRRAQGDRRGAHRRGNRRSDGRRIAPWTASTTSATRGCSRCSSTRARPERRHVREVDGPDRQAGISRSGRVCARSSPTLAVCGGAASHGQDRQLSGACAPHVGAHG